MNTGKHYAKGSTAPTIPDDGKLRLYSMRFCPYAQRVHLVLAAKEIPHHVIYINLTDKPEWFFAMNPLGKVPALQIPPNDFIYESLIVADYLDDAYPQNKLSSSDLLLKAKDRILIDRFGGVQTSMYKLLYSPNGPAGAPGALTELVNILDIYEEELKSRKTPYFGGVKPGMLDYMIWPWCERSDVLKLTLGDKYELDLDRFQKLLQWRTLMKDDPAVKASYITPENHVKFMQSRQSASGADYDMLAGTWDGTNHMWLRSDDLKRPALSNNTTPEKRK